MASSIESVSGRCRSSPVERRSNDSDPLLLRRVPVGPRCRVGYSGNSRCAGGRWGGWVAVDADDKRAPERRVAVAWRGDEAAVGCRAEVAAIDFAPDRARHPTRPRPCPVPAHLHLETTAGSVTRRLALTAAGAGGSRLLILAQDERVAGWWRRSPMARPRSPASHREADRELLALAAEELLVEGIPARVTGSRGGGPPTAPLFGTAPRACCRRVPGGT